jgi:hypothetical protein
MTRAKPKATLVLGAGWSYAAGLPLTKDIFRFNPVVAAHASKSRLVQVAAAYDEWAQDQIHGNGELFLQAIHRDRALPWAWLVEYVAAVLANPVPAETLANRNVRYSQRLTNRTYCATHLAFVRQILSEYDLTGVVTTNYDLLAERALRHRPMLRPPSPGFHYGGLPQPQIAVGLAQPFTVTARDREVEISGAIPLYKLHGSLNWYKDPGGVTLYQDLRLAFKKGGVAEIIPPLPEKEAPSWLRPIWESAESRLGNSAVWIVAGFSLPPYDLAVRDLFARAAGSGNVRSISIFDPYAESIANRWGSVAPGARLELHPEGVPMCSDAASLDRPRTEPLDLADPTSPRLPGI